MFILFVNFSMPSEATVTLYKQAATALRAVTA